MNPIHFKIDQVYSKNNLPPELIDADPSSNDGEIASTSTDQPIHSGFFTVNSIGNGLKTYSTANDSATKSIPVQSSVYVPTKIVEISSTQVANTNVMAKTNQNLNPLPLMISSVASGEEVTLMTNGFSDTDDKDTQPQISDIESLTDVQKDAIDSNNETKNDGDMSDDLNDFSNSLLIEMEMKTEPIDISDDEQKNEYDVSSEVINTEAEETTEISEHIKGYIYCSTNVKLGKINIEWSDKNQVKLHLAESVDVDCGQVDIQMKMSCISSYMTPYIRKRFYGVYPACLILDWIFIKVDNDETSESNLVDFNKTDPFSVRY